MSGIVTDILSITDDILGLRDDLGAKKQNVYILTRTWDGSELGDGTPSDVAVQILPTPHIVDYAHSLRLKEGGNIREGDIILKHLSKQTYTDESMIDCSVSDQVTEKYYYIDEKLYTVIHVKSDYVYWNVHIRKAAKQSTYL